MLAIGLDVGSDEVGRGVGPGKSFPELGAELEPEVEETKVDDLANPEVAEEELLGNLPSGRETR